MKPKNISQEQLLALLDDIRARVAAGDSFEGSFQYMMPEDDSAPHPFDVTASYRIGNSEGQGGMRLVGTPDERPLPNFDTILARLHHLTEIWDSAVPTPELRNAIEDAAPLLRQINTQYAVAYGGDDPNEANIRTATDDEAVAQADARWTVDGYPVARVMYVGPWERIPVEKLDLGKPT